MTTAYRPRRSVLYMPASNERALEKAKTLPVDGLIFDLEDAVGPQEKEAARENARAAAACGDYGYREVTIRVNGTGTQWHEADLEAACAAGPDGIVVPKVGSADEVRGLVAAMEAHGAPEHTRLWAMVETPDAVLDARAVATASGRLAVLVLGTNDLVTELQARFVPGRGPLLAALSSVVLAARAAGVAVLDGVYNDVRDLEGLAAECRQGRDLGFDGKTLIHPGQIGPCHEAFTPSAEEVEEARGLLAAWEAGAGRGVVTYEGRMVENLHVEVAQRVLATDEAVRSRS
ncbi:CoA ester lyase [Phycicoccus endophyticus]|uniref:CoA ester lyase n=1 Tax=Phycicoccus endophyticus TaxID=1690220 RepID=A0A7G9QYY3_9MICO|nr:CoA ester lyase [Phycicoccus endophyticus]NHI18896.1 CoA ester lyase [Phycicoccus endophyticus]QNN48558.1 CoA ester lyase [Phycicoccus endophyticus]GGL31222.1 citrate lyase subunit beta [Phycicoccus endophyticus]